MTAQTIFITFLIVLYVTCTMVSSFHYWKMLKERREIKGFLLLGDVVVCTMISVVPILNLTHPVFKFLDYLFEQGGRKVFKKSTTTRLKT